MVQQRSTWIGPRPLHRQRRLQTGHQRFQPGLFGQMGIGLLHPMTHQLRCQKQLEVENRLLEDNCLNDPCPRGSAGPQGAPHARPITVVSDRPRHDRRNEIDPTLTCSELGWQPRHTTEQDLESTVRWFLDNLVWCKAILQVSRQPRS